MVKIETAVQISPEHPYGKSDEYIWMLGQSWPVPAGDDVKIIRVEAFGAELDTIGPRFSGGQILKGEAPETAERVLCRTWRMDEARYVSEQMRVFYP